MKYPSRHIWKGVKKKSQHLILTKSYYVMVNRWVGRFLSYCGFNACKIVIL